MTTVKANLKKAADYLNSLGLGYDKSNRWAIKKNGEADCSTICGTIIKRAGYPIDLKGTFYTGNFASRAKAAGFKAVKISSWSWSKVLSYLKDGMFLLAPGHHIEFYWNGKMFSARFDERGKGTGGKTGDQGDNVGWTTVKNRPGGYSYILVPPADPVEPKPDPVKPVASVKVTEGHLAAALKAVGSTTTRSKVRVRKDGTTASTSLAALAELCTTALADRNLNGHAVASFLGTMLQESAWLATTVEYGDDIKKYDPYRGRTFEQLTWKDNYAGFGAWCKSKGLIDDADVFVKNPELLGDLQWAWLGGVWYFDNRKLWDEASSGDFQRVQTAVNMGTATTSKVPAGWTQRLMAYRALVSSFVKPKVLDTDGTFGTLTAKRFQEFLGGEIDGELGPQTWFLVGKWLGLSGSFDLDNSTHVKKLQTKIGLSGGNVDGVWWQPKSKRYGPTTTEYLQRYLNKNR